jgi:hypothetical protein
MTNTEAKPSNSLGGRLRRPQPKPHVIRNQGSRQLLADRLSVPEYRRPAMTNAAILATFDPIAIDDEIAVLETERPAPQSAEA